MADLIDRQALIAEINRIGGHPYSDWETAGVLSLACRIPAVDAVEVVRCKDCTEWDKNECECSHWYGFRENDFCSYGERRVKDAD